MEFWCSYINAHSDMVKHWKPAFGPNNAILPWEYGAEIVLLRSIIVYGPEFVSTSLLKVNLLKKLILTIIDISPKSLDSGNTVVYLKDSNMASILGYGVTCLLAPRTIKWRRLTLFRQRRSSPAKVWSNLKLFSTKTTK